MSDQPFALTLTADDLDRVLRSLDRADHELRAEADGSYVAFEASLRAEADRVRALRVRLAETRSADALRCREEGEHVATTRHTRADCPLA